MIWLFALTVAELAALAFWLLELALGGTDVR